MSEGIFAASRRRAYERGLQAGPYGICPICDTPALDLVRVGEWLLVDPCTHPIVRLDYLRGQYPIGPRRLRKGTKLIEEDNTPLKEDE